LIATHLITFGRPPSGRSAQAYRPAAERHEKGTKRARRGQGKDKERQGRDSELAGLAGSLAAFYLGQAIFTRTGIPNHLGAPGALQPAGQVIIGPTKFTPPGHLLSPWAGFAVFCGYAAAVLITGAITIHARDA
jgi:hypothetical protein